MKKCAWATKHELEEAYHDTEWGVPVYDDRLLFELLTLEGAQAGLSWTTVLVKREHYRKVFDNFEATKIVQYDQKKIDALLSDAGIIRNKLKIHSVVSNAQAFLDIQKEYGSFSKFIWSFVDGKPIQNTWKNFEDIPSKTEISDHMSKVLKKKGFKFVGSTICYAFMQAVGMVNDHTIDCFRYQAVKNIKSNIKQ